MNDLGDKIVNFLFLLLLACCVAAGFYSCHEERQEKESIKRMDARELHYDANDWFILIDTSDGHIGIYNAEIPVKHIFVDDLEGLRSGTYPVLIYDGKDE